MVNQFHLIMYHYPKTDNMENVKNITPELDIAEDLQNECHSLINMIKEELPKATYEDAMYTWLFKKLGDIEFRLRKLEGERNAG